MNVLSYLPFLDRKKNKPQQVVSQHWEERECILNPENNLFVWERTLDDSIVQYLKTQISVPHKPIRHPLDKRNLNVQIEEVRNRWTDDSKMEGGELFWRDVYQVARDFLAFSDNGIGVLHLKIVSDNACAKFHIDGYDLRLFTSYLGPGTEWLPEEAVNRTALGTSNERIVKDSNHIKRLGTGHVGILKGEHPNKPGSMKGIVHRSPEISTSNEKRIILRIDI